MTKLIEMITANENADNKAAEYLQVHINAITAK